ncbi:MAG: hypothetical protein Q8N03_11885 [Ignavibacteria bacterium]|nr:hypothetical protein [Ignavibacteria bacterium]
MKSSKIIYQICVGDIQEVATEILDRKLSDEEINKVERRLGDCINWYDAIEYTLSDLEILSEVGEKENE